MKTSLLTILLAVLTILGLSQPLTGSTIAGTVTGTGGAPLEYINVEVYRPDGSGGWDYVTDSSTQADGRYSLGGLAAGTYRVGFFDLYNEDYASEYYNNAPDVGSATNIVVGSSATVSGINASLAKLGSITGVVTEADGVTPLEGIRVIAYYWDEYEEAWYWDQSASTEADGSYSLGGLAAGTYRVGFFDWNFEIYATEYHSNATSITYATNIVVGASATVSGINASLTELGHITGVVTGTDGVTPLEDIQVRAYVWNADEEYWDSVDSTYTQADGSYNLGGLDANSYRLRFYDDNGIYAEEYYNNAPDVGSATDIAVGPSAIVSGINASLAQASRITGTVTGPGGAPLEDIEVYVYRPDGSGGWDYVTYSYTQADGSYSLGGLTAGTYRVGFFDSDNGFYATEYHNNATSIASATDIVVGASVTVSGINASLAELGVITGVVTGSDGVTPLEDIQVRAYYWDENYEEWYWDRSAYTQADGSYSLRGLDTNSYRLRFYDSNGIHETEYYNNAPDLESATDLQVVAASVVSGINASLVQASRITGTVTGPGGAPLEDVEVYVYRPDGSGGWEYVTYSYTQEDGSYSFNGLAAGTYRVGFFDWYEVYADEYYNNVPDVGSAANIVVGASSTVSGINASMSTTAPPAAAPEIAVVEFTTGINLIDAGSAVNLGTVTVGQTGTFKAYRIRNLGNKNLTGISISSSGSHASDFEVLMISKTTLTPGDETHFNVFFKPKATGTRSAVLKIVSNDADENPFDISLVGTGVVPPAPEIAVESPTGTTLIDHGSAVSLGTVTIGQTGTIKTFTIRNLGNQNLTGIAISSSGSHAGDIVLGTPGATTLAPGAKTSFTVAFKPYSVGARSAALKIVSNDADENLFDISLVGSCIVPTAPEIAVKQKTDLVDGDSTVNFGTTTSGVTKTFTIRNFGTARLTGLKIRKKGSNASDFVVSKLKTNLLDPGSVTTFKVTFKPSAKGNRSCAILISSNDANENPFNIQLKGKGTSISSAAPAMNAASRFEANPSRVSMDHMDGRNYRTLTIFKFAPGETVAGTVEVSSNLVDWFSGSAHTTIVADNGNYFKVRDNIPISKNMKRFIRLKPGKE